MTTPLERRRKIIKTHSVPQEHIDSTWSRFASFALADWPEGTDLDEIVEEAIWISGFYSYDRGPGQPFANLSVHITRSRVLVWQSGGLDI